MPDAIKITQEALLQCRPFIEAHRQYADEKYGVTEGCDRLLARIDRALAALTTLRTPAEGEREAFEAFFADSRRGRGVKARETLLARHPERPDEYAEDSTQRHWWTWQHARASLSVSEGAPNLACKSVQKRLATQWGYVKEGAQDREPVAWDIYEHRRYGAPGETHHRVLWVEHYRREEGTTPDLHDLLNAAREGGIDGASKTISVTPLYTSPAQDREG